MMSSEHRGDSDPANGALDSQDGYARRSQLVDLFLRRSLAEVELMRRRVPALIANEADAWQELRFLAQRIAGQADGLALGVLAACARELADTAQQRFAGATLDAGFLLAATSAIEMLSIELNGLFRSG